MKRQQDQHYVVTGGGTGIGRAIAIRLAEEGAKVTLIARTESALQSVVSEIESQGGTAQYMTCDISNQSDLTTVMAAAVENFGPLRGVMANSGIGGANFPGLDDRFDRVIQINVNGTYYTLRAAQNHLIQDERSTHMIVTSSCLGRFGVPGYTAYCASKASLLGMVRAFALELAGQNTQVNALCPGWVDTDMAWEGLEGAVRPSISMRLASKGSAIGWGFAPERSHANLGTAGGEFA